MSINNFPNDNIDPIEKATKKYGREVAKAIIQFSVRADFSTRRIDAIRENRDFASNNQSVDPYKPLLNAAIDTVGSSSYMSIDWSISTPAKKMVDTIVGGLLNQDNKIQFNSISPYSRLKREADRDGYFKKLVLEKEITALEEQTGIVLQDRKGFNPKDADEIDLYMDMEYRQPIEIGMEEIVDFELYNNDWNKKIEPRVIKDLVENSEGRCRLYFDQNNKIRLRYVDLENYYAPATSEPDYSDVDYEGELIYLTIKDLRLRDSNKEVTEEQWKELAIKNSSKNGNPYFSPSVLDYNYNDFRISVLDFVYYTVDQFYYEETVSFNGRNFFDPKPFGYVSDTLVIREKERGYEGLYILNSEIILQYGLSKNILRHKDEHDSEKLSPKVVRRYISFKIKGKSIVEVMKPNLNNIQLLVLRKRHIISEINPTGVAIDISGIKDVMAMLGETDPLKIIKMYKQKGIVLFSRADINGDATNTNPIQELGSPFAQLLLTLDQSIISEYNIIRENIGINDARDGSSPNKDALVGIEKLKLLASNNVTRELYNAFLHGIYAPIGKVIARMVQYKVEYDTNGIHEYDDIIGKLGVKSIEFAKDIEMSELGIKVESVPTGEDIQELMDFIMLSLTNKEIRPEDAIAAKNILNTKKAIRFLMQRRKKVAEETMLEFQQREEITGQREQQSAMTAAEAEKVKAEAKANATIMVEEAKNRLAKELDDYTVENKLKIIDRESYWDMKKIEEANKNGKDNKDTSMAGTVKVFQNPERAATRLDGMM